MSLSTNTHGADDERRGKPGRPPHVPPIRPHLLRLTDEQAKLLRLWGRGDMAAGLRWLIDAAAPLIRRAGAPHEETE